MAAGKGDVKAVLHWLRNGADKDWVYARNGYTPLMLAAKKAQANSIRVLTAAGWSQ